MMHLLVLFGATGDLAFRKLIPSLYHMFTQGDLQGKKILAVARRDYAGEKYKEYIKESLVAKGKYSPDDFDQFCSQIEYFQLDFDSPESYDALAKVLDGPYCVYTRFFYLAVPQNIYIRILENLFSGKYSNADSKVIIEKPFGFDMESSIELQGSLSKLVKEENIYRIDHYLGKEILRKIPRFVPDTSDIAEVQVVSTETIGVENRGDFYDINGAFRDVGGNHLLEVFTLLYPNKSRTDILKEIITPTEEYVVENSKIAQHEGYKDIKGVASDSTTETYFRIILDTNLGLKLTLEAGKGMDLVKKYVKVMFRDGSGYFVDYGVDQKVCEIRNGEDYVCYDFEDSKDHYVREYAILIKEAFNGDKTYFITPEEVSEQWRITDPIVKAFRSKSKLLSYKIGEPV
jgi:glucose-6-phosphate 1-dehydrogenase